MNVMNNFMTSVLKSLNVQGQNVSNDEFTLSTHELLKCLSQCVFVIDTQHKWLYLNNSWSTMTGFSLNESIGCEYDYFTHPKDRNFYVEQLSAVIEDHKKQCVFAVRFLTQDGEFRWMEMHASRFHHPQNENHCIVGTLTDITDRVNEEEQLLANHRNLKSLIDDLPGMVYRCRNDHNFTMEYVSQGSYKLTGFPAADIMSSKKMAYGSLIHPEDRESVWTDVQSAVREKASFELVYRIITAGEHTKWVWERGRGIFTNNDELLGLEGFISDITYQQQITLDQSSGLSLYDAATELPTTPLFKDRIKSALHRIDSNPSYGFAVLLVHIDRFKSLLDKHPAAIHDSASLSISERIKSALSPLDSITRIKPDRYGILLERVVEIKQAINVSRNLQKQIQTPFEIENGELRFSASIGIVLSEKRYDDSNSVLHDAHTAMDRARSLGGAKYEVFDFSLQASSIIQAQTEKDLKKALEQNNLAVNWKPSRSSPDGKISNLQACLAWTHPRRGQLTADQFVPIVENTQVIHPLWVWILNEIDKQLVEWNKLPIDVLRDITLEIDVNNLHDTEYILQHIQPVLQKKPDPIQFAITLPESCLTTNNEQVERVIQRMKRLGVKLIVSGFGSGSIALNQLRQFPIYSVKLHPSLIDNAEDNPEFLRAIVSLAHSIGIRTTIESEESKLPDQILKDLAANMLEIAENDYYLDKLQVISMLSELNTD